MALLQSVHTRRTDFAIRPLSGSRQDALDAISNERRGLRGLIEHDKGNILAQDWSRDYLDRYQRGEITPDLTIEHLSDLLEIFQQAGVQ